MPSVSFEVWCSCGAGLCNQTEDIDGGIKVQPCEYCLASAREESYDDGYTNGYDDGFEKGEALNDD